MNFEDIIYDTKTILSKANITNDMRSDDEFIAHKINNYRSKEIRKEYELTRELSTIWLQDLGQVTFSKVNSADDPSIENATVCLGKYTIPPVVILPDDLGLYRVGSSSKFKEWFRVDISKFYMMLEIGDTRLDHFIHYYKIGDAVYEYPYQEKGNIQLILENPMDGYKYFTEVITSGNLKNNVSYEVFNAQISYNGTTYDIGDTFTCTTVGGFTYTGTGYVKYTDRKQTLDYRDRYPIGRAMAQKIVLQILIQDYGIERQQIADTVNDAADQFKILSSETSR